MTRIVILAAGKGTRMNVNLPKVLVKLNGLPMIRYLMDSVAMSGVDQQPLIIVSADNKEIISQELQDYSAQYVIQDKQLGTGHAVACALEALAKDKQQPDKVVVFYGDHPFVSARTVRELAKEEPEALTITSVKVNNYEGWHRNFYHWGRVIRGIEDKVERVVELKEASEAEKKIQEVNGGFMCLNFAWAKEAVKRINNQNSQQEYYLTDLVKLAVDDWKPVSIFSVEPHEAMGINSLEELRLAEGLLKEGR